MKPGRHLASCFLLLTALLAGCGPANSSASKGTAATSPHTTTQATKSHHSIRVPSTAKTTTVNGSEWVDPTSSPGLVKVINQSMTRIEPGVHGPAKWAVAVDSLDNKHHAYLTNWSPGHAQSSASTIKLFILIRYYQELQRHQIHASDRFTLTRADKKTTGSGILLHKPIGSTYTLSQLVTLMIEKSDNIATNALIDRLGSFKGVNQTISQVVGTTHFSSLERKMMDISNLSNGKANRINAWEATEVLLKMYQGKLLGPIRDKEMLTPMLNTENRTKLPARLPAGATCWNKSGESNFKGIENDMAIIRYQGHVFAISALIELDADGQTPHNAIPSQTASQVAAIARLGAHVTNWMAQQ